MERGEPIPESTEWGWWELLVCFPDNLLAPRGMITLVWELLGCGGWKLESRLDIGDEVESVIRSDSSVVSKCS